MTQREFAQAYGIGYSTLTKWIGESRRLTGNKTKGTHLIEVKHPFHTPSKCDSQLLLESPSGWRIHLSDGADLNFTAQLMELCSR